MTSPVRKFTGVTLAATLLFTASGAPAQEGAAADNPILDELNRTPNLQLLAQAGDPNVRKANAVVNGQVVTDTDVDQRLALVLASNPTSVEEEEKQRLRLQVMRNLIDEKLQIQEARDNDIFISDAEIDEAFARVAQNVRMTPEQFTKYLNERGTSSTSIRQQITGELAWGRLLRRRVQPFVNVGDDEVENMLARMEAAKGTDEFRLAELVFYTTPETGAEVMSEAERIVEQLRQGASFIAYARQYSQSSSATVGGDLGWLQMQQLDPALQPVVAGLSEGQVTRPIQLPGKVLVLALLDKRQVLTADEDDALLSLKQMSFTLPPNVTQEAAQAKVRQITEGLQTMGGCGGVERTAEQLGAEVTSSDQLRLGDLPSQLKTVMAQMQIGQSTPPFGSLDEGIKVLTLCGREQAAPVQPPSFDNMYAQLEESRVNSRARRYLRDLRRDAIIDYR